MEDDEELGSNAKRSIVTGACVLVAAAMTAGAIWHTFAPAPDFHEQSVQASASDTTMVAEAQSAPPARPVKRSAQFSCRMMGNQIQVSMCFVGGDSQGAAGSLAIRNGGSIRQYTTYDIMAEFSAPNGLVNIALADDFAIAAQANGADYSVLHIDIIENGQIVASREASRYGVIAVKS